MPFTTENRTGTLRWSKGAARLSCDSPKAPSRRPQGSLDICRTPGGCRPGSLRLPCDAKLSRAAISRRLRIPSYFNKWKLTLNTDIKTKIVMFNTISEKSEMFFYGNKQIDVVTQHRYLGIKIDKHMSIKTVIAYLYVRASRAYAAMYKALTIHEGTNPKTIIKSFDALVVPIIMYCREIWAPFLYKGNINNILSNVTYQVEKLHIRFCKHVIGMKKYVSNMPYCRIELGRYPLAISSITNCYKYYLRLHNMNVDSLLWQSSVVQKWVALYNKQSISYFIEKTCGYTVPQELYNNNASISKCQISILSIRAKNSCIITFEEIVRNNIKSSGKLEVYAVIKRNLKLENYFLHVHNVQFRKALTRVQLSSHNMDIEQKTRYCKTLTAL